MTIVHGVPQLEGKHGIGLPPLKLGAQLGRGEPAGAS
jgi:hypothetical protein